MKYLLHIAVILSTLNIAAAASAGLKVGDKAPPLSIKDWIKGKPIDPTHGKANEVFVVEFWATWCGPCRASMPHLSEMQEHFKDKNVTFLGVSAEKKATVESFLKKGYDKRMRYTVATDKNRKTNHDWMAAAGQQGIPTAFVVKGGIIKWIGHPMNGLDLKVAELSGDQHYAQRKKQQEQLQKKLSQAAGDKKWGEALKAVEGLLQLEPKNFPVQFAKYHLLVAKLNKADEGARYGYEIIKASDIADNLSMFSWTVLTHEDFAGDRDIKLAMAAAQKAMKLSEEKSPSVMDTYARALAESNDLPGAIKWQTRAVELCQDARMKRELKHNLDEFKKRASKKAS